MPDVLILFQSIALFRVPFIGGFKKTTKRATVLLFFFLAGGPPKTTHPYQGCQYSYCHLL